MASRKIYYLANKEKVIASHKIYALENKEKLSEDRKAYYLENKEHITQYNQQYYLDNKEELDAACRANDLLHASERANYRVTHKEEMSVRSKEHYRVNKVDIIARCNAYAAERAKVDPLFKMANDIRHRIHDVLKAKSWRKNSHFSEYIGCSLEELKAHLENQFTEGMTWYNHTRDGWHIDHIVPLSSAKTLEEFYKLCHYTNLQPLWADDNLRKGKKLI